MTKKTSPIFVLDHVVVGVKKPVHILEGDWSDRQRVLADLIEINKMLKLLSEGKTLGWH